MNCKCIELIISVANMIISITQDYMSDSGEYEVEKIMAKRTQGKKIWYLVKWLGYSHSDNSWEPLQFLQNAPMKVQEYESRNKSKLITKSDKEESVKDKPTKQNASKKGKTSKKQANIKKIEQKPMDKEDPIKKEKAPVTINLIEDTESDQEMQNKGQINENVNIDDFFLSEDEIDKIKSPHSDNANKHRNFAKIEQDQPIKTLPPASLANRPQKAQKTIPMVVHRQTQEEKQIQIRGIKRIEDKLLLKFIYLGKKCKAEYEVIRQYFPISLLSFYEKHCDLFS